MQVHAHPDDEASKGAPSAARYVAEGARAVLVTCTAGEAGEILNPGYDGPTDDMKAVRLAELDSSAKAIGYDAVHLLGYRDSGMPDTEFNRHPDAFANAPFDEAVERLVAVIREERPQVIITYGDEQSYYPHPDHVRVHDISVVAFDAAGDAARFPDAGEPWQPPKLYYSGWTLRYVKAMHEALVSLGKESWYEDRIADLDPAMDARVMTRIDVGDYLEVRDRALLAHRTQIDPDSFWFAVPLEMRREIWPWEEYVLARTLVDNGVPPGEFETDLFAGLR